MRDAMQRPARKLRVSILDDYQDAVRTLDCYSRLQGHDVTIWHDTVADVDVLAGRLAEADALVLMRERTKVDEQLLSRLPNLRLISQNGHVPHIDLAACTRRGVVVRSALSARPSYPTVEVHLGLILAAMRNILFESAALRNGVWQSTIGLGLRGRTPGIFGQVAGSAYGGAYRRRVRHGIAGLGASGLPGSGHGRRVPGGGEPARAVCTVGRAEPASAPERRNQRPGRPRRFGPDETHGPAGEHQPGGADPAGGPGRGSCGRDARQKQPSTCSSTRPLTDPDDPLLRLPNALCTPHLGYVERDNYEFAYGNAFDQIAAFASGAPINVRNPDVLKQDQQP